MASATLLGTATLAGGSTLAFTAVPPAGIAGRYSMVLADDDSISGATIDGRPLAGGVAREFGSRAMLVAALVEQPDGIGQAIVRIALADVAGEQRWINRADGSVVGGSKAGIGSGFMDGSVRISDGTSNT